MTSSRTIAEVFVQER